MRYSLKGRVWMSDYIQNLINDMKRVKSDYGEESLSVKEVLNLPAFKGYKLLAGGEGLEKRCKHITILETPTGIDWLEGGEFLLTAGYAFIRNEEYKENLISDANAKGVSAIGIKKNRYFGNISDKLISEANEFKIPLIEIPYDVVYTSTISSFYDMLFYRKNEYILKLNDIYEKLINLSFENKNIDGIIYSLSNLSNSNVFLFDDSYNLMCYNIINPEKYDRLSIISPFNKMNINMIKQIENSVFNAEIHNSFISLYPIIVKGKNVAYVYITNEMKLDKLAKRTIEYGISIISMKLETERTTSILKSRVNKASVEIMLNSNELPDEFYKNVELNLNWDEEGLLYGICIKLNLKEDEDIDEHQSIIYNCLNSIIDKNNYLSTINNDEIFIVIKCKSSDLIDDFLSRLVEQIKIYEDIFKESIGVARPYKELKDIKKLYEEASLAVLFSDNDIIFYNSLDTIKLLYPLKNSSEIQKYYKGTIKSLEKYDKKCGTNLMETLETYFKYNFKKSLVADKLYIHVETLRYRLNRIEEITGYSPDDSEGLFALQMGLKLKKLIKIK